MLQLQKCTGGFTIKEVIPIDQHNQQETENKTHYY